MLTIYDAPIIIVVFATSVFVLNELWILTEEGTIMKVYDYFGSVLVKYLTKYDQWVRKDPLLASFYVALASATVTLVLVWLFFAPAKPLHIVCHKNFVHVMGNDLIKPILDTKGKPVSCEVK